MSPRPVLRTCIIVCFALSTALFAAGCSDTEPSAAPVTVVVTPTVTAPAPTTSAASTSKAIPKPMTHFSGACDDVLSDYTVAEALGGNTLSGKDLFIVGQPEKDINRLAYLNCKYGVTGSAADPQAKIEVGLSLYRDAKSAATRIAGTVTDYSQHGAHVKAVSVQGNPAHLLTGGKGSGYTEPLLVMAAGQRTVAVNLTKAIASGARVEKATTAIAAAALKNTAG